MVATVDLGPEPHGPGRVGRLQPQAVDELVLTVGRAHVVVPPVRSTRSTSFRAISNRLVVLPPVQLRRDDADVLVGLVPVPAERPGQRQAEDGAAEHQQRPASHSPRCRRSRRRHSRRHSRRPFFFSTLHSVSHVRSLRRRPFSSHPLTAAMFMGVEKLSLSPSNFWPYFRPMKLRCLFTLNGQRDFWACAG